MSVYNRLADPHHCFVIAEIGANHDGDLDQALRLMDIAQKAGADAVKFQSFLADLLLTPDNPNYAMMKRLEVPQEWYPRLKKEAESRGLVFFSTASNTTTLQWMADLGVELYKLASPSINHLPLIKQAASIGKPVILSTGLSGWLEVDEAVRAVQETGNTEFALLHCTSEYPAPPESINLRAMSSMMTAYPDIPIGYSDHSIGDAVCLAAAALGARVIEKHITLDSSSDGPDHHYAMEPDAFVSMVPKIREIALALGASGKNPSAKERELAGQYLRSLHFIRDISPGQTVGPEDIDVLRPNDGLHPRHLDDVVGMTALQAAKSGDPVNWHHFKSA